MKPHLSLLHPWPGELRVLKSPTYPLPDPSASMAQAACGPSSDPAVQPALPKTLKEAREQLERGMVLDALVRHGGRISEVSQELGVSRHAFLELAVKLGIAVH